MSQSQTVAPEPEIFKNRKEAHDWLNANGYSVSQGKFYTDIKEKGFPVLNPDKTLSRYQVAVYGKNMCEQQAPDPSAMYSGEMAKRKEKADMEMAEMRAEKMRREEDADWLHASSAWAAIAHLMGSLRQAIRHHHNQASAEMTLAVGGDPGRSHELFEMIEAATDTAFNEIAGKGIEIQFEDGE